MFDRNKTKVFTGKAISWRFAKESQRFTTFSLFYWKFFVWLRVFLGVTLWNNHLFSLNLGRTQNNPLRNINVNLFTSSLGITYFLETNLLLSILFKVILIKYWILSVRLNFGSKFWLIYFATIEHLYLKNIKFTLYIML